MGPSHLQLSKVRAKKKKLAPSMKSKEIVIGFSAMPVVPSLVFEGGGGGSDFGTMT